MDKETTPQGNNDAQASIQNESKKEAITSTNNELQSSNQADSSKKKTNTKRIFLIVSLILMSIVFFFVIVLPVFKYTKSLFFGPSLLEYESYLSKKYKDDTFYYVSGNPSCGRFDSGFCSILFSSKSLNGKTFTVRASHESFSDNYYETKYGFNLEEYYSEKYGKPLEKAISDVTPYTVSATIVNPTASSMNSGPFDSFNDYLTKLEQNDTIKAYLVIKSSNINIYNLSQIDFALIESEISKVIEQDNLKLVSVNLVILNNNREDTGVCPKEFNHTIRSNTQASFYNDKIGTEDKPDGRSIDSCLRIIYSKAQ